MVDCTVPAVLLKSAFPCGFFPPSAATQTVAVLFLLQVNGRTESGVKTLRGTEKSK